MSLDPIEHPMNALQCLNQAKHYTSRASDCLDHAGSATEIPQIAENLMKAKRQLTKSLELVTALLVE